MAAPSLMQRSLDLPIYSRGSALSSPSRQRRGSAEYRHVSEITLLLEQKRTRPGVPAYLESVQVPISSTVKDVKLKLQNLKGWHADKARCSLVSLPAVYAAVFTCIRMAMIGLLAMVFHFCSLLAGFGG